MLKSLKQLSFIIIALSFSACSTAPKPVFGRGYKPDPKSVTVMTYNIENLFDTKDDVGKNDEAYMPLKDKTAAVKNTCRANNTNPYYAKRCMEDDWRESYLERKMMRLSHVIRRIKDGKGPDVLIVQEVENQGVLDRLRKDYLGDLGYKPAILLEGPDERGIDVGVITRLEIDAPITLHEQTFVANEKLKDDQIRATRGILEVNLKMPDGTPLTVYGVHFPSQGAPTEARRQAVAKLIEISSKLPEDRMVVVAGDFNITSEEDIKERYISRDLSEQFGVSHVLGCHECEGTYYYRKGDAWSFLDMILLSKNMLNDGKAPWKLVPESIRIENESKYQISRFGTPARFAPTRKDGVSDHWPMVLELTTR